MVRGAISILQLNTSFLVHVLSGLNRFKVEKGKLFYKTRKELWVEVVMSKSQRIQILKACHSDPSFGESFSILQMPFAGGGGT